MCHDDFDFWEAEIDRLTLEQWFRDFQGRFAVALEEFDGAAHFVGDRWARPGGGGGETRVLAGGRHLEKAAVNFSAVAGPTPRALSELVVAAGDEFYATGVSIIVHPANPHAPTVHANLRYFESSAGASWFGGGCDLTPYYLYEEDVVHFHGTLRTVCADHPVADYRAWKEACDRYFFLPHRGEARGVGGLFFDHLTERRDAVWAFMTDLGDHLAEAYLPILERRVATSVEDGQRAWHALRRGRYVEFNLLWDRGTRFGIETAGRTESILASLPPTAHWEYGFEPQPGSPEARLLDLLRGRPRSW